MASNREWKSFRERWSEASRLEKFVIGSIALHLVALSICAVVLAWPSSPPTVVFNVEPIPTPPVSNEEAQKEELLTKAQKEVDRLLKQELAAEQLRPTFEELTRDFLDKEQIEAYWDELLLELTPELDELANLFDESEEFDGEEVTHQVGKIQSQMLARLTDLLLRDELDAVKKNLGEQLDASAEELANAYREGLRDKVGVPIGESMQEVLATEQRVSLAALRQAESTLETIEKTFATTAERTKQAQTALHKLSIKLEQDQKRGDQSAAIRTRAQVRQHRAANLATSKNLDRVSKSLETTTKALAGRFPALANRIAKFDRANAQPTKKTVQEMLDRAGISQPEPASKLAGQANEQAEEAVRQIARLREAVQVQITLQETRQLARTTKREAEGTKKIEALEEGTAKITELVGLDKRIWESEKSLESLKERVQKFRKNLENTKPKETPAKQALALSAKNLEEASVKFRESRTALSLGATKSVEERLREAANRLDDAHKSLAKSQGQESESPNAESAVAQQLEKIRQEKLQPELEAQFRKALTDRAIPTLLKKVGLPLDRTNVDPKVAAKLESMKAELVQRLQQRLEGVEPAARLREGIAQKLPPPETTKEMNLELPASTQKALDRLASTAFASMRRTVPQLVQAELSRVELPQASGPLAELLRQLGERQRFLASKQRNGSTLPDGNGVARARARHMSRKAMLSKARRSHGWDMAAYQRMAKAIESRELTQGEPIALTGAEGETLQANPDTKIRPAVVHFEDVEQPISKENREVPEPAFQTHRFAGVPFLTNDAIQIDGELQDWQAIPTLDMAPVRKGAGAKIVRQPTKQTAYLAFCPKGILIAVDVVDTSGKLENGVSFGQFWFNDGVEVYLDTQNTKSPKRGEVHTHQFFAFPFGHQSDPDAGGYEAYMRSGESAKRLRFSQEVMPRAGKKTANGWTLEMLIPHSALREAELAPGRVVGFNLQIDSGTAVYYYWTAAEVFQTSMHPNTWGDLQLLGSDAKIVFLDEEDKEMRYLIPGQPLKVRIEDPDMNRDPSKKEQVSLMVKTSSGESLSLLLEETEANTGTFETPLPTRLHIGAIDSKELQVYEGERLTVEYIDQIRAFGERNETVKAFLPVSSLGTRFGS